MSWIKTIADSISNAVKIARKPFPTIQPYLLLCQVGQKPGLSSILLASAIIARLPEIGLDTGPNRDGSPNMINGMVRIISEEVVKHFRENANIQCAINAGGISITATGGNAGGPVVSQGTNNLPLTLKGCIN